MTSLSSEHLSKNLLQDHTGKKRGKWTQTDAWNIFTPQKIRERKQDRSDLFLFLEGVIGTCLSWDHKDTLLAVYTPLL